MDAAGINYVIFRDQDSGLLRPQRNVLTTIRSPHVMGTIILHPCRLMGCSHLTKYKIFRRPGCEPQKQNNITLRPVSSYDLYGG